MPSRDDPGYQKWLDDRQRFGIGAGASYKDYQSSVGELVDAQIRGETESPTKADVSRSQILQEMGPVQIEEGETITPTEYRTLTGGIYDKRRHHFEDEDDVPAAAGVREKFQPLPYSPPDLPEKALRPREGEEPAGEEIIPVEDNPLFRSAIWGPKDEKLVRQGVTSGFLVTDGFKAAPARGFQWAEEPQEGRDLPGVVKDSSDPMSQDPRYRGFEREDAFELEFAGKRQLVSDRFEELTKQGQSPRGAAQALMMERTESQEWLQELDQRRKARPHPQLPGEGVYLEPQENGALIPKSTDPDEQAGLDDPVKGAQVEKSPWFSERWERYWADSFGEFSRLQDLGYPEAARRHFYERYFPTLQETGTDIVDILVWTAEKTIGGGVDVDRKMGISKLQTYNPSKIKFFQQYPDDADRDIARQLRAETWAALDDESKQKAALDPAYFVKKMYQQREVNLRTAVEQAHLASDIEEHMRANPDQFPPGKIGTEIEIPVDARAGIHYGILRAQRGEAILSNSFSEWMVTEGDETYWEIGGKKFPITGPGVEGMLNALPTVRQYEIMGDVQETVAHELAWIWEEAKRRASSAGWQANAEVEGFRTAGSGIMIYDPNYLQTTYDIAMGNEGGGGFLGWMHKIKDIPMIGDDLEGIRRIIRGGTARQPSMHLQYYPDSGWGAPLTGPTASQFKTRTGGDWLYGLSGTSWGAGIMEPAREKLWKGDSDAGDHVYRWARSLTGSPYEYLDSETGESKKLMAMGTEDQDWLNSVVDSRMTSLSPSYQGGMTGPAPAGDPFGYRQYNRETKEIEIIGGVEVLKDFAKVLEETYEAHIGPHMTPSERMKQVASLRKNKFLAEEMGTTFAHLADSLEVDADTKNAMVIGGSVVLGFVPEFINPIDPIVASMWVAGKGMGAASKIENWRKVTRPDRFESNATILENHLLKAEDAVVPTSIHKKMKNMMAMLDPIGQILVEARAAQKGGFRQSVVHHLDKAHTTSIKAAQAADRAAEKVGFVDPIWVLPGADIATPIEQLLVQNQLLTGYKKYDPRKGWIDVPSVSAAHKSQVKAREFVVEEVASQVQEHVVNISRSTHDQDVYSILRTEDFIKEHFPEAWEVAQAEQKAVLRIAEGEESTLYPVFLGRLEDKPYTNPMYQHRESDFVGTLFGWSKMFRQFSEPDAALWATVLPKRDPSDATKVLSWNPISATTPNPTAYESTYLLGATFRGNNHMPSMHKNLYGRAWDPKSAPGELPSWYNETTRAWEKKPTLQDLGPTGREDYERWYKAQLKAEREKLSYLEQRAIVAAKVAEEFESDYGPLAKHFETAKDEFSKSVDRVKELGTDLKDIVLEMDPWQKRRDGYALKMNNHIAWAKKEEETASKIWSDLEKMFPGIQKTGSPRTPREGAAKRVWEKSMSAMEQHRIGARKWQGELAALEADPTWKDMISRWEKTQNELRETAVKAKIAQDRLIGVDLAVTARSEVYPVKLKSIIPEKKLAEATEAIKEQTTAKIAELFPSDTQIYSSIVSRRLRASASRAKQASREQRKRLARFDRYGEVATEFGRVKKMAEASKKYSQARDHSLGLVRAYREVAKDLRKGLIAQDSMPRETSRVVDALSDSGALVAAKEPTAAHRFMARFTNMVRAYGDSGAKDIRPQQLLDYLNEVWGSRAVDYLTETIRPKGKIFRDNAGRALNRREVEIMQKRASAAARRVKELQKEIQAFHKTDEFKVLSKEESDLKLENMQRQLKEEQKLLHDNDTSEVSTIGSRGGRAGDILRRVKDSVEEGTETITLTMEEIEDFQHINTGLRHAWRESHVERVGLNYVEALDIAAKDVFGSLAIRAAYYQKPLAERAELNFYLLPSIFDKEAYTKDKLYQLKNYAKRLLIAFDPIRAEIGETTKSVENVFRASKNLSEHAGEELHEYIRMALKKFKGMSPETQSEATKDAIFDYLTWDKFDEPLRIEYPSAIPGKKEAVFKNRTAWMPSGGQIWGQMLDSIVHNIKLLDDHETIGETRDLLKVIRKEASKIEMGGTPDGLLKNVKSYMKSDKYGGPGFDGELYEWIKKRVVAWAGDFEAGERRKVDELISRYGADTTGTIKVGSKSMDEIDSALSRLEFESITLDSLLNRRFGLAEGQKWFARSDNIQQSAIVHAFSRMFIPQGHAPSASRAAVYYHKTLKLLRQPEARDPRWFFKEVERIHNKDFGPDFNYSRSLAMGALAAIDGAVMYRSNRLMERAIGGFMTPQQVADGNKFLGQAENSIQNWDAAIDSFIRIGRPLKQDVIRSSDNKTMKRDATKLVLSGMDESGRSYFMPENIYRSVDQAAERVVKELSVQFARARTPEEVLMAGNKWSFARLWRTSIVTGLVVPQPRYFTNNWWGDFSQIWLTEGIKTAGQINFQLIGGIPWWSKNLNKLQDAVIDSVGKENVLGSSMNALMNPTANRIWRGEQGYMRLPDGRFKSFNQIRTEMIESGILDTMAHEDLLSALSRATPKSWKELPLVGGFVPEGLSQVGMKVGEPIDDWMQNISWWASYVQQRQRGNFYMEMLRRGYTEKEATKRTFAALYDWKHGLTQWEVKNLASWVPFYRFWRLALTQMGKQLMQPMTRPSERMVDLHSFGLKNVPGEFLGQTGLNRVRQQHVFTSMMPQWTDPELWAHMDSEEARQKQYALATMPEWVGNRGIWGIRKKTEDQQAFLKKIRGRAASYGFNAMGPMTAIDTSEYLLSSGRTAMGAFINAGWAGEELKSMLAPDFEEQWIRSTLDMMFPLQKEFVQQALMTAGVDAGGHYKGLTTRLRPGEALLANTTPWGYDAYIDPDTQAPMGDSLSVTVGRMVPVMGTEIPGVLNNLWAENYPMQKFSQDFMDSTTTAEGKDFVAGLWAGLGKFSAIAQQYPLNPDQVIEHRARDKAKAVQDAKREWSLPRSISDLREGYPGEHTIYGDVEQPEGAPMVHKRGPWTVPTAAEQRAEEQRMAGPTLYEQLQQELKREESRQKTRQEQYPEVFDED